MRRGINELGSLFLFFISTFLLNQQRHHHLPAIIALTTKAHGIVAHQNRRSVIQTSKSLHTAVCLASFDIVCPVSLGD